ncbi:MAG: single-stranded DNA-binding protein [Chitinophagaceae bacterium]
MIKLMVIGHLGKDCITNTVSGKSVINFSVAHSEKFKDAQGNPKDKTTWVECAYWTDRTAIAPYLKKGQLVYAEGSPEVRSYAKNDGTTGVSLTIRVSSVQLLGGSSKENGGEMSQQSSYSGNNGSFPKQNASEANENSPIDDDLPF